LNRGQGPKNKVPVVGTASLNLAEYASAADQKEFELNIPLTLSGSATEPSPSLCVCASESSLSYACLGTHFTVPSFHFTVNFFIFLFIIYIYIFFKSFDLDPLLFI
jgi:hypothetical protein